MKYHTSNKHTNAIFKGAQFSGNLLFDKFVLPFMMFFG
jgi:hypothetical protein